MWQNIKRIFIGAPIATAHAHFERLGVFFGLALLASDNISVVAYATEEILRGLALAGEVAIKYAFFIAVAIVTLIIIVLFSYSRTIRAYPQGGGDYRVAKDNLSDFAGRVAGAALLLDYTLTVAVSVSAGVLAIVSAFPAVQDYILHLNLTAIAIITLVNLRGTRESGLVFAVPTYTFVALTLVLLMLGLPKVGVVERSVSIELERAALEPLGIWLILRAFAAGCAALTGIEAIANGTMIFKSPEVKNATHALIYLGLIVGTLFLGVSWLATHYPIRIMSLEDQGYQTVLAQVAERAFGEASALFYSLQFATMAILILAANTAFSDFPRICSFIAKDGYLPRQLANLGDRLVFQNGILLLAFVACGLILFSGGDTHRLIPLYALGVFTAFTLGQAGMVVRQLRHRAVLGAMISGIGMLSTGTVWFVILITKFAAGAWMIVVALGVLLITFWGIRRHYDSLARQLTVSPGEMPPNVESTALLLLPPRVHRGILQAIAYARTLSPDLRAVTTVADPASVQDMKTEWEKIAPDIPLVILESPYRSIVGPVVEYIDAALGEETDRMLTVIVPEAIAKHWWQRILHNNSAIPLKMALAARKNVVVTNVRYFLSE